MYVLSRMSDTVRIEPHQFRADGNNIELLKKVLNNKLANKVVLNVGLCICFYDFESIGDSVILPGDGASHTRVVFRFVCFRPFIDEVIQGKIRACDNTGLHLTIQFFDDIFVPADKLRDDCKFREMDQVWVWEYETEEGEPPAELFMEPGAIVKFRVVAESFQDTQPGKHNTGSVLEPESKDPISPYSIIASMAEDGLGCVSWWINNEDEAEDEDEEGEGEGNDEGGEGGEGQEEEKME